MMDTSPDLSHRARSIRIAIAITVLKHKPLYQSFDAHVLDLRAKFLPREIAVVEYELWRERALELEVKLKDAEERFQNEHVELAALEVKLKTAIASEETSKPSSPPPANSKSKGRKKKTGQPTKACVPYHTKGPPHPKFNLDGIAALKLPPIYEPSSVLSSLRTLELLMGRLLDNKKTLPDKAFITASKRALDALAALLSSALQPESRSEHTSATLGVLSRLLPQTISSILTVLSREPSRKKGKSPCNNTDLRAALDQFMGSLTTSVLVPLMQSYAPSSSAFYAFLNSDFSAPRKLPPKPPRSSSPPSSQQHLPEDIRPLVASLLQSLVDDVLLGSVSSSSASLSAGGSVSAKLSTSVANVLEFLTLETIRELERLYSSPGASGTILGETSAFSPKSAVGSSEPGFDSKCSRLPPGDHCHDHQGTTWTTRLPSADSLTRKLARKDTLWYICNTLHLLLDASSSLDSISADALRSRTKVLDDPVYVVLSGLFRRMSRGASLDLSLGFGGWDAGVPIMPGSEEEESRDCGETRMIMDECGVNRVDGEGGRFGSGSRGDECALVDADMDEAEGEMVLAVIEKFWLKVS